LLPRFDGALRAAGEEEDEEREARHLGQFRRPRVPSATLMSEALLPCVEIEPRGQAADAAVIWLHGLGADGHDFEPIVPELGLGKLAVRFVFPHAPAIPVSLNYGMVMPAWYDIAGADLRRTRHDAAGIRKSVARVEALIARERGRGVAAKRIVLAGFSQGGAVAVHAALRHHERLAGLVALSTYLPAEDTLEGELAEANADLPVLQCHGSFDPMVPQDRGEACRDRLVALGHPVDWHVWPMEHQVCAEEIEAIGAWLRGRLA
jgi:phospholipase/carboxylesterase